MRLGFRRVPAVFFAQAKMNDILRYLMASRRVRGAFPGHWELLDKIVLPGDLPRVGGISLGRPSGSRWQSSETTF